MKKKKVSGISGGETLTTFIIAGFIYMLQSFTIPSKMWDVYFDNISKDALPGTTIYVPTPTYIKNVKTKKSWGKTSGCPWFN